MDITRENAGDKFLPLTLKLMKDSGLRVSEPKSLLEEGREQLFPDRFRAIVKIKGKTYGYMKIGEGKYELLDISKPFVRVS